MSARKLYDVYKGNTLIAESIGIDQVSKITKRTNTAICMSCSRGLSINGFTVKIMDDIATLDLYRKVVNAARRVSAQIPGIKFVAERNSNDKA